VDKIIPTQSGHTDRRKRLR